MTAGPTETTSLLPREEGIRERPKNDSKPADAGLSWKRLLGIIGALLGVFLAGADESMVLVTYQAIASHFKQLGDSPWVLAGYNLGYCVALPVYGKLSDTYGRQIPLVVSYCLFSGGCILSGTAAALWQVIAGRVITGIGAAGMVALVCVLITDNVSPSQVAITRSYVNMVSVFGRVLGGPIGAFITDSVGWQLSFVVQAPTAIMCCIISIVLLPPAKPMDKNVKKIPLRKRVDFLGIAMFAISITTFLVALRLLGDHEASTSITILFGVVSVVFGAFFLVVETYYAREPVIPPGLLKSMAGPYAVQVLLQVGAFANLTNIAPYFIRTTGASNTRAAIYLAPVFVGFTTGSVTSGYIIRKTHRYKTLSIISVLLGLIFFTLIAVRWRTGVSSWESLYVLPAFLSFGLLLSTTFTGLIACTPKSIHATAICVYYLCQQVGTMLGTVLSSLTIETILREVLKIRLQDIPNKKEIIERVLHDSNPSIIPEALRSIVRSSYLYSFQFAAFLPVITTAIVLPLMAIDREVEVE
ncbi:Vacuolar membrane amino acid uptake transporter [Trichophyton interdigitale]|uniref:Vacuolar membrane amino acid uptake transporter n=1 Tax=Trichophyton interdigitale TaxID=101480 RepID=A0A9P4YEQ9_9EURO|nr:Vacuolar membrane amino acid uptake transporter [Trichophyton interdigitale]KAG5208043.1 Vacuolar membrane amino acid uptake transporter [Trichophyton interdigitale]KAG8208145.1 Vacuolar membrane amino acid uptake transporter [Trichophyton interdigitale]